MRKDLHFFRAVMQVADIERFHNYARVARATGVLAIPKEHKTVFAACVQRYGQIVYRDEVREDALRYGKLDYLLPQRVCRQFVIGDNQVPGARIGQPRFNDLPMHQAIVHTKPHTLAVVFGPCFIAQHVSCDNDAFGARLASKLRQLFQVFFACGKDLEQHGQVCARHHFHLVGGE